MARALTLKELTALGLSEEDAKVIVDAQDKPKPRVFRFVTKITQELADEINKAYPAAELKRAKWTK